MIKFREVNYSESVLTYGAKGAALGSSTAILASTIVNELSKSDKFRDIILNNKFLKFIRANKATSSAIGSVIGAALLVGLGMLYEDYSNSKSLGESSKSISRFIDIINILSKRGYKRGVDFAIDPSDIDKINAKVSIVVKRTISSVDVIINSSNDNKSNRISKSILRSLPEGARKFREESDQGLRVMVSVLPTDGTPSYVADIAERFIKGGMPVYLFEVER